jgi:small subunit ribosomal protein S20
LANLASAKKRIRQNEKRRLRNKVWSTRSKTSVRRARQSIAAGDRETALAAVQMAIRDLDRAASKGVIHKNNAARRKSRLLKQFATLSDSN